MSVRAIAASLAALTLFGCGGATPSPNNAANRVEERVDVEEVDGLSIVRTGSGRRATLFLDVGSLDAQPPGLAQLALSVAAHASGIELERAAVFPEHSRVELILTNESDATRFVVSLLAPERCEEDALQRARQHFRNSRNALRADLDRRSETLALVALLGGGADVFSGDENEVNCAAIESFWQAHYGPERALLAGGLSEALVSALSGQGIRSADRETPSIDLPRPRGSDAERGPLGALSAIVGHPNLASAHAAATRSARSRRARFAEARLSPVGPLVVFSGVRDRRWIEFSGAIGRQSSPPWRSAVDRARDVWLTERGRVRAEPVDDIGVVYGHVCAEDESRFEDEAPCDALTTLAAPEVFVQPSPDAPTLSVLFSPGEVHAHHVAWGMQVAERCGGRARFEGDALFLSFAGGDASSLEAFADCVATPLHGDSPVRAALLDRTPEWLRASARTLSPSAPGWIAPTVPRAQMPMDLAEVGETLRSGKVRVAVRAPFDAQALAQSILVTIQIPASSTLPPVVPSEPLPFSATLSDAPEGMADVVVAFRSAGVSRQSARAFVRSLARLLEAQSELRGVRFGETRYGTSSSFAFGLVAIRTNADLIDAFPNRLDAALSSVACDEEEANRFAAEESADALLQTEALLRPLRRSDVCAGVDALRRSTPSITISRSQPADAFERYQRRRR